MRAEASTYRSRRQIAMTQLKTQFAPPERADIEVVTRQAALGDFQHLARLYDAVNDIVLVLNSQRQIVFANRNALGLLGAADIETVLGLRPGEAMGCTHACENEAGCGTTQFCSACGAVNAILTSQAGKPDRRECRILREQAEAMDLLVRTTPLKIDGEFFTVCAIADISHEKRRRALERTFFHDVLNTAMAAQMLSERVACAAQGDQAEKSRRLEQVVEQLMQEILQQRDLMAAETAELPVHVRELAVSDLLESLVETYSQAPAARGRHVQMQRPAEDLHLESDKALLLRVLGNLIKNALEACSEGQTVTVSARAADGGVEFCVHNPGVMSQDVQLQLFQRSFSTKGDGRGLGTYSIKLLTERYLGGKVSFTSRAGEGTIFRAFYPHSIEPQ